MKKFIILLLTLTTLNLYSNEESFEERLTDLELKSIQNSIKWDINVYIVGGYIKNKGSEDSHHMKNTVRFSLSGEAHPNFQYHATLQTSYLFNSMLQTNNEDYKENQSSSTSGAHPYILNAFFDWNIYDGLTISAGRLPTTYGPPLHYTNGTQRKGTYPTLAFNIPFDGIALSATKGAFTSRSIYIPGSLTSSAKPYNRDQVSPNLPSIYSNDHEGFTQMIEYERRKKNSISQSILGIVQYTDLTLGAFHPVYAHEPYIGTVQIHTDGSDLANFKVLTGYLDLQRVASTPFDIYLSYAHSWTKTLSSIYATTLTASQDSNGNTIDQGTEIYAGKFMNNDYSQGNRFVAGLKYNMENVSIGAEYWKSSRAPSPTDIYSDDLTSLGQILGSSKHLYVIKKILNKKVNLKFGYTYISEYARMTEIEITKSNQKIQTFYTAIGFSI